MQTANLELCKELYELSGWDDTDYVHWKDPYGELDYFESHKDTVEKMIRDSKIKFEYISAYDLGFLLRKLPGLLDIDGASFSLCLHTNVAPPDWTAYYMFVQVVGGKLKRFSDRLKVEADTPEDAVCKLAIELFKEGVLDGGNSKKD